MSEKILFWIFISLGAGLEVAGDVFFKKWSTENRPILIWSGYFVYSIGGLFWAYSLKYEMLSKAVSIFIIVNLVIAVLVGTIFFKENLSAVAKLGILLGIISIVLIERG
jgi:drug/metabolite transporter (DMT)-like permease